MEKEFSPGDRVVLARVLHLRFLDETGTVKRILKTKGMVRVILDCDRQPYDAHPENLDYMEVD